MSAIVHVVDDDERSRRLIVDVLRHLGYSVVASASGTEAVEQLGAQPADLVLLDIQLPGLNGFQVLQWLRAQPWGAKVPVFAVTASVMPQERTQMLDAGFTAYLPKPISVRELLQTVGALLPQPGPA